MTYIEASGGVTIGDGAVIAAGSVITKNVPPYTMGAGNPAEKKKIMWQKLEAVKSAWWDWPLEKIVEKVPMLMSERWKE